MKKQKTYILIVILMLISIGFIILWNNEKDISNIEASTIDKIKTEEIDVINEINLINEDTSIVFPTDFRIGHVKAKTISNYLKMTDYGYIIVTKSGTSIPTPLIVNEKIYLSGGFHSKEYFCFDKTSGKNIWAVDLDDDGPSTAVYSDSIIYFNTESCTIFALEHSTGKSIWSYWLGDPLLTTPSITRDLAITTYPHIPKIDSTKLDALIIKPSHPIIAFDQKTGKIKWQKWLDGDIISRAVPNDSIILVTTFPGTLYKLNAIDGKILSSIKLDATSIPTIKNGLIYITRRNDDSTSVKESIAVLDYETLGFIKEYNSTVANYLDYRIQKESLFKKQADLLDAGNGFMFTPETSGWKLASKNIGQSNVSSLQLFQGSQIKFIGDTLFTLKGNTLYSINSNTEQILWSDTLGNDYIESGGFAATPVEIYKNEIIIVTLEGELRCYSSSTGEMNYIYDIGDSVRSKPVIDENWIYIPTMKGKLVCIDLEKVKNKTG